jgi:hypothetical protein
MTDLFSENKTQTERIGEALADIEEIYTSYQNDWGTPDDGFGLGDLIPEDLRPILDAAGLISDPPANHAERILKILAHSADIATLLLLIYQLFFGNRLSPEGDLIPVEDRSGVKDEIEDSHEKICKILEILETPVEEEEVSKINRMVQVIGGKSSVANKDLEACPSCRRITTQMLDNHITPRRSDYESQECWEGVERAGFTA